MDLSAQVCEAAARGSTARAVSQPRRAPSSSDRPRGRERAIAARSHRIGLGTLSLHSPFFPSSAAFLGASKEVSALPLSLSRYRSFDRPCRHPLLRRRHAQIVGRWTSVRFLVRNSFVSRWAGRRSRRWRQWPPSQEQSYVSTPLASPACSPLSKWWAPISLMPLC